MAFSPSGISAHNSENSSNSDRGFITRYMAKAITYPTGHWHLIRRKLYDVNKKRQSVTGVEIKDILFCHFGYDPDPLQNPKTTVVIIEKMNEGVESEWFEVLKEMQECVRDVDQKLQQDYGNVDFVFPDDDEGLVFLELRDPSLLPSFKVMKGNE